MYSNAMYKETNSAIKTKSHYSNSTAHIYPIFHDLKHITYIMFFNTQASWYMYINITLKQKK